jgi:hypothetical protein
MGKSGMPTADEDDLDRELRALAAGDGKPPAFIELSAAERAARSARPRRQPRTRQPRRRSSDRARLARLTSRPWLVVAAVFIVLCLVAYGLAWLSSH